MSGLQAVRADDRPVERCSICARQIRPDAKRLPLFGKVGDDCYSKYAAFSETLKREGLGDFLNGPVQFQPIESEDAHGVSMWVYPEQIMRLQRRAEALGFCFVDHWPRMNGPATCDLKLPVGGKARRRLVGKLERIGAAA